MEILTGLWLANSLFPYNLSATSIGQNHYGHTLIAKNDYILVEKYTNNSLNSIRDHLHTLSDADWTNTI